MAMSIEEFVQRMPKAELHVHIEGTLLPELRYKLCKKHDVPLKWSSPKEIRNNYTTYWNSVLTETVGVVEAGEGFFELYFGAMDCFLDEGDYYELAIQFLDRCKTVNLKYLEIFFNLQSSMKRGVKPDVVLRAYRRAREYAAKELGVRL